MAGLRVGQSGKAGQALLIHEDPNRVAGCDQDVDSHIKLEAINEEGLRARKPQTHQGRRRLPLTGLPCTTLW